MKTDEAVALIEAAVGDRAGVWADVGAGEGTFTRALVELLGPSSRIYAVDQDASAVAAIARWSKGSANVVPVEADFSRPFSLPHMENTPVDGILLANALHFVRDGEAVLARLVTMLRPGGRLVIVEYDRRASSRWVPYPIPITRLPALAAVAGLSTPTVTATRPSEYQGILYAAAADRVAV